MEIFFGILKKFNNIEQELIEWFEKHQIMQKGEEGFWKQYKKYVEEGFWKQSEKYSAWYSVNWPEKSNRIYSALSEKTNLLELTRITYCFNYTKHTQPTFIVGYLVDLEDVGYIYYEQIYLPSGHLVDDTELDVVLRKFAGN